MLDQADRALRQLSDPDAVEVTHRAVHVDVGRADELRRLFSTYSSVRTLPEPDRTHLLDALEALVHDRFDGTVTRPYLTVLYTAPRL